jgi:hypothetical protein
MRAKYPDVDIQYTFAQVGVRDSVVDYSGNCGNLSSMIGVFAVDEGICKPRVASIRTQSLSVRKSDGGLGEFVTTTVATIRSLNNNTDKLIDTTFPVRQDNDGNWIPLLDLEQTSIAGVPGKASQITLDFVSPGGARTGKLLPTGNPVDLITIRPPGGQHELLRVRASLVDATNPTVFVTAEDLHPLGSLDYARQDVISALEEVRQKGAEAMGLDPSAQAQPKISVLSMPGPSSGSDVDVDIHALSMGVLHKAVPMTVGLCLGVAAGTKDTLAWDIVNRRSNVRVERGNMIRMKHPSGVVEVGAEFDQEGHVTSAKVVRTGRRLMKGVVWW